MNLSNIIACYYNTYSKKGENNQNKKLKNELTNGNKTHMIFYIPQFIQIKYEMSKTKKQKKHIIVCE